MSHQRVDVPASGIGESLTKQTANLDAIIARLEDQIAEQKRQLARQLGRARLRLVGTVEAEPVLATILPFTGSRGGTCR